MNRPLPKNMTTCPACGVVVSKTRRKPHPETNTCLVNRTAQSYRARGWSRIGPHRATLERAGVLVEDAPGTIVPGSGEAREQVRDVGWAPQEAVEAVEMLSGLSLKAGVRSETVRALAASRVLRDAFASALALGGKKAVMGLIKSIKQEEGST